MLWSDLEIWSTTTNLHKGFLPKNAEDEGGGQQKITRMPQVSTYSLTLKGS
jgi:hypothetical protein